jgi:hypothetical protein
MVNRDNKHSEMSGRIFAAVDMRLDRFDAAAQRVNLIFQVFGRRHEARHMGFDNLESDVGPACGFLKRGKIGDNQINPRVQPIKLLINAP